jgi:hypothetical protein
MKIIIKILKEYISYVAMLFMNDVGIKGRRDRYSEKKISDLSDV